MKKLLSLFIVLVLLMSFILTGCKKSENIRNTAGFDMKNDTGEITDEQTKSSIQEKSTPGSEEKPEAGSEDKSEAGSEDKSEVASVEKSKAGSEDKSKAASVEESEAAPIEEHKAADSKDISDNEITMKGNTVNRAGIAADTAINSPFYGSTADTEIWEQPLTPNTEEYSEFTENGFCDTASSPLSTFSIDVDTASYANLRKNINSGMIPDADSVRIEEMLNYFSYDYKQPENKKPFSVQAEIGKCPWNENNYMMMVGIQGKDVDKSLLPKSNLVFLIDVSGSMDEPDKLPLIKKAFAKLTRELEEKDKVSIVVYAGETGVVLDSVRGNEHNKILHAIESLSAGGSTAGASGLGLAYRLAEKNYMLHGNNRVILATDGDFNVGPSSMEALEEIITEKRKSGIYLSVMGFGAGNIKDNKMELLADKGNGNYSYIDSVKEAERVLVKEMAGTLLTIAKDVKIQLEFNPYSVEAYRLIGYENRALENKDFKNDSVDAGELGAGHTVTAIYEIVPGKANTQSEGREDLKYQSQGVMINKEYKNEISEIRLRYKEPKEETSEEIKQVVSFTNTPVKGWSLSNDFYFASAVVEFGMLLRNSDYLGNTNISSILELAKKGLGEDAYGYRSEFIELIETYRENFSYRW